MRNHPLRATNSTSSNVYELAEHTAVASAQRDLTRSLQTVQAVGEVIAAMQAQIAELTETVARNASEIKELRIHKEAAYSAMSKAETAARADRARAEEAERLCADLSSSQQQSSDHLQQLFTALEETFGKTVTKLP